MRNKPLTKIPEVVRKHYLARIRAADLGRPSLALSIGEVAKMFLISVQAVQQWQTRFGEPDPDWLDRGRVEEIEENYARAVTRLSAMDLEE